MISICIPVYNFDIRNLVDQLTIQKSSLNTPFEIIIIDDCSNIEYRSINNTIIDKAKYVQLKSNIGRAAIRNSFLKHAQYPWLLFLDNDVIPASYNFLKNYCDAIQVYTHCNVFCGGRIVPATPPLNTNQLLHWYYGNKRENIPIKIRKKHPYRGFITGNFIIHYNIFEKIHFDENLRNYGHEDTLFGYQLKTNQISVQHIDNPVIHLQFDSNADFIKKNELAIKNLYIITKQYKHKYRDFENDLKLIKAYRWLKKTHLVKPTVIIFNLLKKFFLKSLEKHPSCLLIFDLYKLGYYCEITTKKI